MLCELLGIWIHFRRKSNQPCQTVYPLLQNGLLHIRQGNSKDREDLRGSNGGVYLFAQFLEASGEHAGRRNLTEQVGGDMVSFQGFRHQVIDSHVVDGGVGHGEVNAVPGIL